MAKKLNFEERANKSGPAIRHSSGGYMTHQMSHAPKGDPDGPWIAYPNVVESGEGLTEMEPGMAEAYARDNGQYREFATEKEAEEYAINGLIDHSPNGLAAQDIARREGTDHPYTVEKLKSMGYNDAKAGDIHRMANDARSRGLQPFIGKKAAGRTRAMAEENKRRGKGSKTTKHFVTDASPDDMAATLAGEGPTARAVDMKFFNPEWKYKFKKKYDAAMKAAGKDPTNKALKRAAEKIGSNRWLEDEDTKSIYSDVLAEQGWGQPTHDPEMLRRGFKKGDWGHAEPLETMRAEKGMYDTLDREPRLNGAQGIMNPGERIASQARKLKTWHQTRGHSALDKAIQSGGTRIAKEAVAANPPQNQATDENNMPMPQEIIGKLQSISDAGYSDDVMEYLTTSRMKP